MEHRVAGSDYCLVFQKPGIKPAVQDAGSGNRGVKASCACHSQITGALPMPSLKTNGERTPYSKWLGC